MYILRIKSLTERVYKKFTEKGRIYLYTEKRERRIMEKRESKWMTGAIVVAIINLLIIIPIFTKKIFFADTTDYLGVARYFYGDLTSIIRNTHSWDYGLFLSFFLQIWNSMIMLRIINIIWILLTGYLLYKMYPKKSVLLLWFLSPIVWFMAPYVHPLPAATFFITCAYYFIKKYETSTKKAHIITSGICIGAATVFWDGMIVLSAIFMLAFLTNKKVYEALYFLGGFGAAFSIKLLTDWVLFAFPLFSTFRQMGSGFLFVLRKASFDDAVHFNGLNYLLILIAISPLLITLYRSCKEHKQESAYIFLLLAFFIFNNQLRYSIIIAPIALLLIAKQANTKELLIHTIVSVLVISYLIAPAFTYTQDEELREELEQIGKDFPNEIFLVGSGSKELRDDYLRFSSLYFGDDIKELVSWEDYDLAQRNETIFYDVLLETDSQKINNLRNIRVTLGTSRVSTRTYEEVEYLITREKETTAEGFELIKEYEILNVFKKN